MKNILKTIAFAMVLAGVVWAARQGIGSVSTVQDPKPQWFQSGIFIGAPSKDPLSTTLNKKAYHLCASSTQDLASVPNTGAGSGCLDSTEITLTGCALGDTLSLGMSVGPPANFNGPLPVPYVSAANKVKIRVCNTSSDGGAVDYASQVYTVCCDGD